MASDAALSALSHLAPGMEVDGFRLEAPLHAGGTASLYRVTPVDGRALPVELVMKLPKVGDDEPAESVLGFEMEAMILPVLAGPHAPRVVAVGDLTRIPHLTMERVAGSGLAGIAADAPLPAVDVARLGAALADAIHAIHAQHVIHHDIKPENVIVRPDGTAVLIDFGFARHAHFPDLLAEERRFAAGSAAYVSPEQLAQCRDDPRGDVFALGVVLYQLATGYLPFGVPRTVAAMRNRLWAAPVPPRARRPELPPWLQEVILRCLEPEAAHRYQGAALVAFDLRHPDQVRLTERAERLGRPRFVSQLGRWWRSRHDRYQLLAREPAVPGNTPIILVAIDTSHPDDPRHAALQWTVRQLTTLNLEFRLACVSAVRAAPVAAADAAETASGIQLLHKVRLTHWVAPLKLPASRVSMHVIESADPAAALLDYARSNHVDLIVLGAPAPEEAAMAWWRSTASTITATAHCSVHVVRVPARPREAWEKQGVDSGAG